MSPSSQSTDPERAVLCQRAGELADFAALLRELGLAVEECGHELPRPEALAGVRLVVATGQRLTEARLSSVQHWPRTIAVLDDGSRTLSTHLARIGVTTIVRRPVHPRTLRLLLLHALYRGPERRVKKRIAIGQPIRTGGGLFKQNATLLELSRSGARIELANPPRVGALIQFVLGKELTGVKPIKVQAKVVRSIPARNAQRTEGQIGVALLDPTGELARPVQAILDRFGVGGPAGAKAAVVATSARGAVRPQASPRPTDVRPPATRPPRPAPVPPRLENPNARAGTSAPSPAPRAPSAPIPPSAPSAPAPVAPQSTQRRMKPVEVVRTLPPSYVEAPSPTPPAAVSGETLVETTGASADAALAPTPFDTEIELLDFELDAHADSTAELELEVDGDSEVDGLGVDVVANASARPDDAPQPDETPESDRRRSTRIAYTRRVVALDEQAARVIVGRDLGYGGLRIDPHPEFQVGDVVKLALHAGTDSAPLVVVAGVERDDGEHGLVLAFAELTSTQRDRLEKIIASVSAFASLETIDGRPSDGSSQALVVGEILGHLGRSN